MGIMRYVLVFLFAYAMSTAVHAARVATSGLVLSTGDLFWELQLRWSSFPGTDSSRVSCGGSPSCAVGIGYKAIDSTTVPPIPVNWQPRMYPRVIVQAGDTWESAMDKFVHEIGPSGSFKDIQVWVFAEASICFMAVSPATDGDDTFYGPSVGACNVLPPVPISCTWDGAITLDHGQLTPSAVNGASTSRDFNASCTAAAPVVVRDPSQRSTIPLGNNVSSRLTVQGVALGSRLNLRSGSQPITVTSTLQGTPPGGVQLSGSTTLIMEPL